MLVGYARTSTLEQAAGLAAQRRDLKAAGCEKIFAEQVSSVAARAKLTTALEFVREGDVLVVTKPDRLARSTRNLLDIVDDLEKRGIALVVLSMGGQRIDTRSPTGKLMLTVLGAIATFERDLMLERQREGIAKAAAEGKYKGRAPTARASLPMCFDWQRQARRVMRSQRTLGSASPPFTVSWRRHGRQARSQRRPTTRIFVSGSAAGVLLNGSGRHGRRSKLPQPKQHGQSAL